MDDVLFQSSVSQGFQYLCSECVRWTEHHYLSTVLLGKALLAIACLKVLCGWQIILAANSFSLPAD